MNFSSKEDIEAPIDAVFAQATDFDGFERAALRRGVDVQRTDHLRAPAAGMSWVTGFVMRGKTREMDIKITEFSAPNRVVFAGQSGGLNGTMVVELVPLSRSQTRMTVDVVLESTNLTARLFLQSLKLARTKLNQRFHQRFAEIARDIEKRTRGRRA